MGEGLRVLSHLDDSTDKKIDAVNAKMDTLSTEVTANVDKKMDGFVVDATNAVSNIREIIVWVETGSTVTATCEGATKSAKAVNGYAVLSLPHYGKWTVKAQSPTGAQSNVVETLIDVPCRKAVYLGFLTATLNVTAPVGATVTVTGSYTSESKTSTTGTVSFEIKIADTYKVDASIEGANAKQASVAVSESTIYTAAPQFMVLKVTIDSGSNVQVTDPTTKYDVTKISNGEALFYIPQTGTYTVKATRGTESAVESVVINSYTVKTLALKYYHEWGVKVNTANSNPETACEYVGNAVGMTPGYNGAWENIPLIKAIKPCVLKNGAFQYYLNKNNFALKEAGGNATINNNTAGDVMIEIPKMGYKLERKGSYQYIWITDKPNADGYCYKAHSLDKVGDCDKIYIGAYLGWQTESKLYSLSGKTPSANRTLGTFRNWAKARGTGYSLLSFYPLTLLQCLYVIIFKNLNSQSALGRGYVDGNSSAATTGSTNAKGMCWGSTNGSQQISFLGIEDFWGNLYQWVDGLFYDNNRSIRTEFNNALFSDNGNGYTSVVSSGLNGNISGYVRAIQGGNDTGFTAQDCGGSETTFFADDAYLSAGFLPNFGGDWSDGSYAGAFRLYVYCSASYSGADLGARLMFKHKG